MKHESGFGTGEQVFFNWTTVYLRNEKLEGVFVNQLSRRVSIWTTCLMRNKLVYHLLTLHFLFVCRIE